MNKQEMINDLESKLKKIDQTFGDRTFVSPLPNGESVSLNAEEAKKLLNDILNDLKKN